MISVSHVNKSTTSQKKPNSFNDQDWQLPSAKTRENTKKYGNEVSIRSFHKPKLLSSLSVSTQDTFKSRGLKESEINYIDSSQEFYDTDEEDLNFDLNSKLKRSFRGHLKKPLDSDHRETLSRQLSRESKNFDRNDNDNSPIFCGNDGYYGLDFSFSDLKNNNKRSTFRQYIKPKNRKSFNFNTEPLETVVTFRDRHLF